MGVRRHDDPLLVRRAREDDDIRRALKVIIANMDCVVTVVPKKLREDRGQRVINEELHLVRGISRSRTASAAY